MKASEIEIVEMSVLFITFCRVKYPLAGTRRCKLTGPHFDAGLGAWSRDDIIESLVLHKYLSALLLPQILCVRAMAQKRSLAPPSVSRNSWNKYLLCSARLTFLALFWQQRPKDGVFVVRWTDTTLSARDGVHSHVRFCSPSSFPGRTSRAVSGCFHVWHVKSSSIHTVVRTRAPPAAEVSRPEARSPPRCWIKRCNAIRGREECGKWNNRMWVRVKEKVEGPG